MIASNYGQRRNPSWYHNLCANPRTRVLFDGDEREMMARELHDDERERWYERGIEIYPGWVQYRKRAERRIPVIELTAGTLGLSSVGAASGHAGSSAEPSSWIVQRGLWATSQGWPSGSVKAAE